MAILKSLKTSTKTVSFRMPKHIADELDSVKDLAKVAGFSLDLTEQIERLITAACKQARAELAVSSGVSNVVNS
jgi:3-hydroxyisobutyrate dehydrogenase-like beta-hydroxyacid dehydrogenase